MLGIRQLWAVQPTGRHVHPSSSREHPFLRAQEQTQPSTVGGPTATASPPHPRAPSPTSPRVGAPHVGYGQTAPPSAGDRTPTARPAPPAEHFTEITVADFHACGLKIDGSIACWGNTANAGVPDPTEGPFSTLAAEGNKTCAVRAGQHRGLLGQPRHDIRTARQTVQRRGHPTRDKQQGNRMWATHRWHHHLPRRQLRTYPDGSPISSLAISSRVGYEPTGPSRCSGYSRAQTWNR